MKAPVDAVFFDVGNTLAGDPREAAWDALAARWPENVVRNLRGADADETSPFVSHFWGEESICREAVARAGEGAPEELLRDYEKAVARTYIESEALVPLRGPALLRVLANLRAAGVRVLGVISNEQRGGPERYLRDALFLAQSPFDVIVASGDVGLAKPDPAIFRHALELAGASPRRSVHVGDSTAFDIRPALRVGMHPVQFTGLSTDPDLIPDVPRIASLEQLPLLLMSIAATG